MKPLKQCLLFCFFILIAMQSHAQIRYPHHVLAGEKFNVVSTTDTTFWVLKESQYNRALAVGDSLDLFKREVGLLKSDLENRQSVITNLKAKVDTLEPAYNRYATKWLECDNNLQKKEIENVKLKTSRKKVGLLCGVGGLVVGGLLGFLIFH